MNEEYNGWLVSTSLVKRSVAVVGHYTLGAIVVYAAIAVPMMLIAMALSALSTLSQP